MNFDYTGFSEKHIEEICRNNIISLPFPNRYIGGEFYSLGILIRKFAYFPSFLPLSVSYDHGLTTNFQILEEQKEACKIRFVFAKWREEIYKPFYKHVKTILFPYIFYRQQKNIKQVENPKGTLVFVAHDYPQTKEGCEEAKKEEDIIKDYIKKIKALPKIYQPVCVCVHINDIVHSEIYKYYLKAGIPVYTAGSESDIRFVKRFYNILKNFKYTMAPAIGSSTLYSLDLGIPFAILKSKGTKDFVCPDFEELFNSNPYEEIPVITQEQIEFFVKNTGYNDSISRLECAKIVWINYFNYLIKVIKLTSKKFLLSIIESIKL